MHQVVLDDRQFQDVLGQGVDSGINATGFGVPAEKVKGQRSTLKYLSFLIKANHYTPFDTRYSQHSVDGPSVTGTIRLPDEMYDNRTIAVNHHNIDV